MLKYITIVATFLVVIDCQVPNLESRISGGEVDLIESHPYVVSIRFYGGRKHVCGGTIISDNIILTAGHCIPRNIENTIVVTDSSFSEKNGTVYSIKTAIRHDGYKHVVLTNGGDVINDIALFKIEPPFVFNETFQPMPLFNTGEKALPESNGTILGWGWVPDEEKNKSSSDDRSFNQLRKAVIPVHDVSYCNEQYKQYNYTLHSGKICAGGNHVGACTNDSGGPLIVDGKLAGISQAAFGKCGQLDKPTIFTSVAYYRKWIDENVEELKKLQEDKGFDYINDSPVWD